MCLNIAVLSPRGEFLEGTIGINSDAYGETRQERRDPTGGIPPEWDVGRAPTDMDEEQKPQLTVAEWITIQSDGTVWAVWTTYTKEQQWVWAKHCHLVQACPVRKKGTSALTDEKLKMSGQERTN